MTNADQIEKSMTEAQPMLERLSEIASGYIAYRPWGEMADGRAELKLKLRDLVVVPFDINEPTRDDCRDVVLAILQALCDPGDARALKAQDDLALTTHSPSQHPGDIFRAVCRAIIGEQK